MNSVTGPHSHFTTVYKDFMKSGENYSLPPDQSLPGPFPSVHFTLKTRDSE